MMNWNTQFITRLFCVVKFIVPYVSFPILSSNMMKGLFVLVTPFHKLIWSIELCCIPFLDGMLSKATDPFCYPIFHMFSWKEFFQRDLQVMAWIFIFGIRKGSRWPNSRVFNKLLWSILLFCEAGSILCGVSSYYKPQMLVFIQVIQPMNLLS